MSGRGIGWPDTQRVASHPRSIRQEAATYPADRAVATRKRRPRDGNDVRRDGPVTPRTSSRLQHVRVGDSSADPDCRAFPLLPLVVNDSQTSARPAVILATLAAIAIALAVCATAATVIVASDVTREREKTHTMDASTPVSIADARAGLEALSGLRELVDSLVATLAPFTPTDSLTLAMMTRQWETRRPASDVFITAPDGQLPLDTPTVPLNILRQHLAALQGDSVTDADSPAASVASLDAPATAPLSAEQLALVANDTSSSWIGAWRRFARGTPLPPLWGYRTNLPGVESSFDFPVRPINGILHLEALNELTGRLALRRGDAQAARTRALENIAVSRHYLESPVMADFLTGRAIATRGTRLARDAARALADGSLMAKLAAFDSLSGVGSGSFMALHRAAERDAADPSSPLAFELFDDDKLPFAVRVEILYAVVQGACGHTREVLFGFSPEREQRLRELADRFRRDPALGPVLGLMPAAARRVRERPQSLLPAELWPTSGMFDFLLPEPVAARAVACQQNF